MPGMDPPLPEVGCCPSEADCTCTLSPVVSDAPTTPSKTTRPVTVIPGRSDKAPRSTSPPASDTGASVHQNGPLDSLAPGAMPRTSSAYRPGDKDIIENVPSFAEVAVIGAGTAPATSLAPLTGASLTNARGLGAPPAPMMVPRRPEAATRRYAKSRPARSSPAFNVIATASAMADVPG